MNEKSLSTQNGNGRSEMPPHAEPTPKEVAKSAAKHLAADAKTGLDARVTAEKQRACDGIASVAGALKSTGEGLREQAPMIGDYTDQAAKKLDEIAEVIRTRSLGELVQDVQTFARREPALFYGGAFALGLIAARFLRSSPEAEVARFGPRLADGEADPEGWDV
jgi:hypothetical protein